MKTMALLAALFAIPLTACGGPRFEDVSDAADSAGSAGDHELAGAAGAGAGAAGAAQAGANGHGSGGTAGSSALGGTGGSGAGGSGAGSSGAATTGGSAGTAATAGASGTAGAAGAMSAPTTCAVERMVKSADFSFSWGGFMSSSSVDGKPVCSASLGGTCTASNVNVEMFDATTGQISVGTISCDAPITGGDCSTTTTCGALMTGSWYASFSLESGNRIKLDRQMNDLNAVSAGCPLFASDDTTSVQTTLWDAVADSVESRPLQCVE